MANSDPDEEVKSSARDRLDELYGFGRKRLKGVMISLAVSIVSYIFVWLPSNGGFWQVYAFWIMILGHILLAAVSFRGIFHSRTNDGIVLGFFISLLVGMGVCSSAYPAA